MLMLLVVAAISTYIKYMIDIILGLLGGVAAGFVGSISSSGGLISVPLMLAIGLPANVAVGTNRFAAVGMLTAAVPRYLKGGKVRKSFLIYLIPVALVGGVIGSQILVSLDLDQFRQYLGGVFLFMLPTLFISREFGKKRRKTSVTKKALGLLTYVGIMIYAGLVGAGVGIFIALSFTYFFGLTYTEAIATNMVAWLILSTVLAVIFAYEGIINYTVGVPLMAGMFVGGELGSKFAIEKGNAVVQWMLAGVMLFTGVRLLFF